jgi:hypothetical protein
MTFDPAGAHDVYYPSTSPQINRHNRNCQEPKTEQSRLTSADHLDEPVQACIIYLEARM